MTTDTTFQTDEARGQPDAAERRRLLSSFGRRILTLWEADGYYLQNARRLRFLTIPRDCVALIAPQGVALTMYVVTVAFWAAIILVALRII